MGKTNKTGGLKDNSLFNADIIVAKRNLTIEIDSDDDQDDVGDEAEQVEVAPRQIRSKPVEEYGPHEET